MFMEMDRAPYIRDCFSLKWWCCVCNPPTNQPTFCNHQGRGPAAAEAVQQGPGPDVVVEERRGAAQLGQTQEQPQERGIVGEEQRHRVALADAAALQERAGGLIAQLVRLPVREALVPEEHEGLVRLLPRQLREAVHDEVALPGVAPDQPLDLELPVHMVGILEQVRMAEEEGQHHQQQEEEGEHEPRQHGGARGCLVAWWRSARAGLRQEK